MPARRAVERNHEAVIGWMKGAWPQGMTAAALGAWLVFEDEGGFSRWRRRKPGPGPERDHPGHPCPG